MYLLFCIILVFFFSLYLYKRTQFFPKAIAWHKLTQGHKLKHKAMRSAKYLRAPPTQVSSEHATDLLFVLF